MAQVDDFQENDQIWHSRPTGLGVEAMSLYNDAPNKAAVLDEAIELGRDGVIDDPRVRGRGAP